MLTTMDLTPRQATRLLEQATRSRVRLEIEPCTWSDGQVLRGTLWQRDGNLLTIDLDAGVEHGTLLTLIGAFCEVRATLGGHVFLMSTCVLDVVDNAGTPRLRLAVPESMQVTNRRRFERTNAVVASMARVWVAGLAEPFIGTLVNVSPDGAAAQFLSTELNDRVLVGDSVTVAFELAGFDDLYQLPALVCSKSLSGDESQITLGLQFIHGSTTDPVSTDALRRLRAVLRELLSGDTQEGAP